MRAPLIRAGGAQILPGLLNSDWFGAARDEARALRLSSSEHIKPVPDPGAWRAGEPARRLASCDAGPVLDAIYADPSLTQRISMLAGRPVRPSGTRGSYSYYDRPGYFLGLHRDIRTCDVTLIVCLDRREGDLHGTGALRLFPSAMRKPLHDIDQTTAHLDVQMKPGEAVLLLGGCIPHEVLPADERFARTVGIMCFETPKGGRDRDL